VLSTADCDGSSGLRDLKGVGGLAIAQQPVASAQAGRARSAIDTGLVDLVLQIGAWPITCSERSTFLVKLR
jgi:two-component system CheB/CheR fusion protein